MKWASNWVVGSNNKRHENAPRSLRSDYFVSEFVAGCKAGADGGTDHNGWRGGSYDNDNARNLGVRYRNNNDHPDNRNNNDGFRPARRAPALLIGSNMLQAGIPVFKEIGRVSCTIWCRACLRESIPSPWLACLSGQPKSAGPRRSFVTHLRQGYGGRA